MVFILWHYIYGKGANMIGVYGNLGHAFNVLKKIVNEQHPTYEKIDDASIGVFVYGECINDWSIGDHIYIEDHEVLWEEVEQLQ